MKYEKVNVSIDTHDFASPCKQATAWQHHIHTIQTKNKADMYHYFFGQKNT